jgi:2-polyprenyl-3-methyl-5-hydroxy-6-metoxy-1,4-benzoquinol methylase
MSKNTANFFDSYASDFNSIYGSKNTFLNKLINKFFRKSMKLRYIKTIEGCDPINGKSILDVGCGPGHYGIALAKKGAGYTLGIDFSKEMLEIAKQNAQKEGVADKCRFDYGDFMTYHLTEKFDYSIVMGFMDYIKMPEPVIKKVLVYTKTLAFFSFPADGGILAWQRKLRYKKRCNLYMYNIKQVENLFKGLPCKKVEIEKISRDFLVKVFM